MVKGNLTKLHSLNGGLVIGNCKGNVDILETAFSIASKNLFQSPIACPLYHSFAIDISFMASSSKSMRMLM